MRMRLQALKSCSDTPLHVTKHLDLSDKGIVAIEGLHHCPLLESLILRCNYIDILCNLDYCRNLWQLDLTGNRVRSLLGIDQFPCIGALLLAYNDLSWRELNHLHHIHILRLTLVGNPQLDSDPNYRQHVISMLPHVWMLDGLLITAGERFKVMKFFLDSKKSARPVWCKSSQDNFTPSTIKNLFVRGKFGPKTADMMHHIPIHSNHTAELDWRRLHYLGNSIEDHLLSETRTQFPLLQLILDSRHGDQGVDQCNMLLLLLLAALKYKLPSIAMAAVYSTAKLEQLCAGVEHIEMLPAIVQLHLTSLLLSAVVLDCDTKHGGVFSHLLLNSILSTFQTVQREIQAERANRSNETKKRQQNDKFNECILAAEVVQMFCLVPTFIDTLIHQSNSGVMKLVATATNNSKIMETINAIATSSSPDKQQQNVASYLMNIVKHNMKPKSMIKLKQRRHSTPAIGGRNRNLYTTRVKSAAGNVSESKSVADVNNSVTVTAGDIVLLSDQGTVAKVISEQENRLVLLQTVSTIEPQTFFYVNVQNLIWNHANGCWETDMRWLDSCATANGVGTELTTHSTQTIVPENKVITIGCHSDGCSNHRDECTEDETGKVNRKISLLVDMSDKSVHDVMAADTSKTIDKNKSRDVMSPPPPQQTLWESDNSVTTRVDLSANYRVMQKQQLRNSDVHLVQPHPPPTSPTQSSYTPIVMQNAWGPLHHHKVTRHTLTSYSRLLYNRKQQRPTVTSSTHSGGTIVLQQSKPHPTAAAASYTDRMPVHQATKLLLNAKLSQWKPPVPPSTRKLGNILTINGSSLLTD